MAVTKTEIDYYFNITYDKMLSDTTSWVNVNDKAQTDATTYISYAYEYLLSNMDVIPTKLDIGPWAYRIIIQEVRWTNSQTNRTNKRLSNNDVTEYLRDGDMYEDINEQLLLHQDYQLKMAAIELYSKGCSKEDKIILDVFIKKNKRTVRSLASHLNIKNTQGWLKLKQMKESINNIYNELKNDNNNLNN